MWPRYILDMSTRVLACGEGISMDEALGLWSVPDKDLPFLVAAAARITRELAGPAVDLCAIINARAGGCTENCAFCAQSGQHSSPDGRRSPLLDPPAMVEAAKRAEAAGAKRFSIVTAGRKPGPDLANILKAVRAIAASTGLDLCCSLGLLTLEEAKALKEAGVSRYHNNLETAPGNFARVCSTHTYADKWATLETAREAGLELCSGGIIGLGETPEQLIEMAFELRKLEVVSVPVNILDPIPGTPLAGQKAPCCLDIIKTVAIFRFILPSVSLRYAGGREKNLRDLQALGLWAGINGIMIGDYLTTPGRAPQSDLQMIQDLGLKVGKNEKQLAG